MRKINNNVEWRENMLNKLKYIINRKLNRSMDKNDITKQELEKMV